MLTAAELHHRRPCVNINFVFPVWPDLSTFDRRSLTEERLERWGKLEARSEHRFSRSNDDLRGLIWAVASDPWQPCIEDKTAVHRG